VEGGTDENTEIETASDVIWISDFILKETGRLWKDFHWTLI
jgi:hypothetical protein